MKTTVVALHVRQGCSKKRKALLLCYRSYNNVDNFLCDGILFCLCLYLFVILSLY